MQKIVILSGAGISAESGLLTFRDAGGLWEGHDVQEVATPEAWQRDYKLVLRFYEQRLRDARKVKPNKAHKVVASLEDYFDVVVITQNVDNLHERGGSSNVLHLHGELSKARSSVNEDYVIDIPKGKVIEDGDLCPEGSQMRPHIVWFGEPVPMIEKAAYECMSADIFVVVGTSMQVYPAAGLIDYVPSTAKKYIIDPNAPDVSHHPNISVIAEKATTGMQKLKDRLIADYVMH
ncbi:MAG: Sir2 family NAD-dependent protein deacetylase [Bacteroidota bacterium]